jgi:ornithine decarboxylase
MTAVCPDGRVRLRLPYSWPTRLAPETLRSMPDETPFLVADLESVRDKYRQMRRAFPDASVFYAMKCNSSVPILSAFAELGAGFEVASIGELDLLTGIGVSPAGVLFSNPVKPPAAIARAYSVGLRRFAFDSEGEVRKLAEHAPGSDVYVRLRVDDSASVFPLSRKFGCDALDARALMLMARELGLNPYGITFHVGSQCSSPRAWRQALAACRGLMLQLQRDGIQIEMLDVGGGFPAHYASRVPDIQQFGAVVDAAMTDLLPYRPTIIALEPGRHLVADSAVLVATVLGREVRAGENWLYLDVGAYNGLMETQQTVGDWDYPMWTSLPDHATGQLAQFTVTGPSCDSSDTTMYGVLLPDRLDVGDRVYIGSAGAYTLSYASTFNGFPIPTALFVDRA